MRTGRYSVLAALAVFLLACTLMVTHFIAGERSYRVFFSLPRTAAAAGLGHPVSEGQININTADAEELDKLPGIGPVKAAAIVAWREEHGLFRYPEELLLVPGIGEGILGNILDLITVGGK